MPSAKNSRLPWFGEGKFPLYLAPMAGFTDIAFRHLCKRFGADVMVSEFVMCEALLRDAPNVWETIEFTEFQRPMGVQIFGSEPDRMAEAAKAIEERLRPDFLDLNFGCPSEKVTRAEAGCSLLRNLPLLGKIAGAVRHALPNTPVTAKIRIGWDTDSIVASETGKILEDEGMEALAIHGRTRMQGYKGDADMEVIETVARERKIPVIANGSVEDWERIHHLANGATCAGAMIGRGALGNPWIFDRIKEFLRTGEIPPAPTLEERIEALCFFAEELLRSPLGQTRGDSVAWMRPKLKALLKDLPHSRKARVAIDQANNPTELMTVLETISARVAAL
ncbi:tRNA dihydrouridine synthase [Puniceicoccus vermicola]|uniref:tRNA-dihydrouridine synthase n=1 Tax=Puniceicoccus vermicola TaxID=388746 RepID=A0A7X1AX04_9BACT|nr:tRNA-dihydrouridine synthase family protein [Puniceicoccus vermicola]MBC2601570.1 tRNA-dihydrouridine synthase family protein [Puniceicoccus vermicola]